MKKIMKLYRQILIFSLVVLISTCYGASYAQAFEDKVLSVDFNSTLITDALHKLSNLADVEIALNGKTDEELISKSYNNLTIDEILLDVFRNKNVVALFSYSGQELVSINLWSLPRANGSMNIIKQQVGSDHIDNKLRSAAVSFTKAKAFEAVNGSEVTINSKPGNEEKGSADKNNKTYIPYVSLRKEPENSTAYSPDIEEDDDYSNDDIPPVPEPVQAGGLEAPPMPPIMSSYGN